MNAVTSDENRSLTLKRLIRSEWVREFKRGKGNGEML